MQPSRSISTPFSSRHCSLASVPLLHRRLPAERRYRINHRNRQTKLRLRRRLLTPVSRRHRKPADLRNHLPVQAKNPRSLPPALSLDKYKLSNRRIKPSPQHSGRPSSGKGQPYKWLVFAPPRSSIMLPLRGLLLHRRIQTANDATALVAPMLKHNHVCPHQVAVPYSAADPYAVCSGGSAYHVSAG